MPYPYQLVRGLCQGLAEYPKGTFINWPMVLIHYEAKLEYVLPRWSALTMCRLSVLCWHLCRLWACRVAFMPSIKVTSQLK